MRKEPGSAYDILKISLLQIIVKDYKFEDFVDRIYDRYGNEEKETTNTATCASYLDLHLEIDSEG
jgi:hypothetical protein